MIKMAIFSDIHGNLPALEAVLTDIKDKQIDQLYCLGDLVDFAPWGNEVIEKIRSNGIPCLQGNHDERIALNLPVVPLPHHGDTETLNRIQAIKHSKSTITEPNKLWLAQLPFQLEVSISIGGTIKRILLVHASTRSNDEYIFEDYENDDLLYMIMETNADALIMGHTHLPYVRQINAQSGSKVFVNCGSVGRSREEMQLATYTVVSVTRTGISAEIVRIPYNIQAVASAIYKSEIPDFYANFLLL